MKKLIIIILILAMVTPMLAQTKRPPLVFRLLQAENTAMGWADYAITSFVLAEAKTSDDWSAVELNPIAKFYIEKPEFAIPIHILADVFIHYGITQVWSHSKFWGWVLLIGVTAARVVVFINNMKQIR